MLILHQLHRVDDDRVDDFDDVIRAKVVPAGTDGARLFWVAHTTPDSFGGTEVATMTAFATADDLAAAGRGEGALASALEALASLRRHVENRLCTFMTFSPVREELTACRSSDLGEGEPMLYLHDFVTPQRGAYDAYDTGMNSAYREMLALKEGPRSKVWAALQVVPGGGQARECVIIGRIPEPERYSRVLLGGIPEGMPGPLGEWMRVAKGLRDTWTSRLVLAPAWSPMH